MPIFRLFRRPRRPAPVPVTPTPLPTIAELERKVIRAINRVEVFWIEGGRRRHVLDEKTLIGLGFGWRDVRDLPAHFVDAIPLGRPISAIAPVPPPPPLPEPVPVLPPAPVPPAIAPPTILGIPMLWAIIGGVVIFIIIIVSIILIAGSKK
jgi:hypothetical protein